jgi:hypothetical protein
VKQWGTLAGGFYYVTISDAIRWFEENRDWHLTLANLEGSMNLVPVPIFMFLGASVVWGKLSGGGTLFKKAGPRKTSFGSAHEVKYWRFRSEVLIMT